MQREQQQLLQQQPGSCGLDHGLSWLAEKKMASKAWHTGMIFAHKIQPQEMRRVE